MRFPPVDLGTGPWSKRTVASQTENSGPMTGAQRPRGSKGKVSLDNADAVIDGATCLPPAPDESSPEKSAEIFPSRDLRVRPSHRALLSPASSRASRSGRKPEFYDPRCAHAPHGNPPSRYIPTAKSQEIAAPPAPDHAFPQPRQSPPPAAQYEC